MFSRVSEGFCWCLGVYLGMTLMFYVLMGISEGSVLAGRNQVMPSTHFSNNFKWPDLSTCQRVLNDHPVAIEIKCIEIVSLM